MLSSTATGTAKDEAAAAALFLKAARRGNAIAQDRLARILMAGRGMPADPTEAIKWHLIAKAGGGKDPLLDDFAAKQTPEVRDAAEKKAKLWLATAGPAPMARTLPKKPAESPARQPNRRRRQSKSLPIIPKSRQSWIIRLRGR